MATAREAYARHDWPTAHEAFRAAREAGELSTEDLYTLGEAAWWLGAVDESLDAWEEAYRRYLHGEQLRGAAMAALHIAVNLFLRGDGSVGAGWMSRAQRLVADDPDSAEHGYVHYLLEVEGALGGIVASAPGALEGLRASSQRIQDLGRRHGDPNLVAGGLMGEGRALVKAGRVAEGLPLLDEAMLAVLSRDMSPEWAGNVYCHLMSAAHELADTRRAIAWTEATSRWLESLPVAVLFTGICRVHRSQVHQLTGAWDLAEHEAAQVGADLVVIQPDNAAEGHYQVGEIRRLRGDIEGAHEAYQRAHHLGRDPQPGLALLQLAEGRPETAAAAVRTALLAAADDQLARSRLLAAQVEIALAAGDSPCAAVACEELETIAATFASSGLEVMARHARGALLLADGEPEAALPVLRETCRRWQEVEAPYDCARVRVLLADAYDALGDRDTAARERAAAVVAFERVGATAARPALPGGLTAREAEVLACVAAGRTNREVADELVISEKTVARHLSNIFTKLGVSSRTQAAAYAFDNALIPR